jgi:hypothetical protein
MEKNKRNENHIHSHIEAIKDAIGREIAQEDIKTNESREINKKASYDIIPDDIKALFGNNFYSSQEEYFFRSKSD